MNEFLTTRDVARLADRSDDSVRKAVQAGRLSPVARTHSGVALFTLAQAEAWARSRSPREERGEARQ